MKAFSQKVIEVVHTDNRYFEKAILFLRPAAQAEDKAKLKLHAGEYLGQIDFDPQNHDKKKLSAGDLIRIAVAALAGAAVACLFFLL